MVFAPVCTGTTTGESDHVSSCTIKVEICAEASFPCTISICVASSSLLKVRKERKFSKHATNSCNSTYSQWIQEIVIVIDLWVYKLQYWCHCMITWKMVPDPFNNRSMIELYSMPEFLRHNIDFHLKKIRESERRSNQILKAFNFSNIHRYVSDLRFAHVSNA